MASQSLMVLVCLGTVLGGDPADNANAEKTDKVVQTALAVQTALQQGREQLLHGEYRAAVTTLEGQLPFVNGNSVYLKSLEDAYRGYIKELRLAKRDTEAKRYLDRLLILDRGAVLDKSLIGGKMEKPPAKPVAGAPARVQPTIRMKGPEERFDVAPGQAPGEGAAQALLLRAEQEFKDRHYGEAYVLFEKSHKADSTSTAGCHDRWAYCKLFSVAQQLEHAESNPPAWADLEQEVHLALELAPQLDSLKGYGKYLLTKITERRGGSTPEPKAREATVAVQHSQTNTSGLYLAETANFRIFHTQSRQFAEQVAEAAERARAKVQQKWFGNVGEPWSLKCDLYLHATSAEYNRATGKYNLPGHSTLRMEDGRLVVRQIDLHCDDPSNMLAAVLPHETTHVVLAGPFGDKLLPRWADEGMAVLTEPREKVERHLDNLNRCRQESQLFRLQDVMELENYPKNPRHIGAFYAQSVSLVDFLCSQKGPEEFTLFLQDSFRYGYEKALNRHYGYRNYAELEQRWSQTAFRDRTASARVADRSR